MEIKVLRKKRGWSQADLAEYAGVSIRTIQRLESGTVIPSVETAKSLASVFDLPFEYFMESAATESQHTTHRTENAASSDSFVDSASKHLKSFLLHRFGWQVIAITVLVAASFLLVFNQNRILTADLLNLADQQGTGAYDVIVEDRANKPLNRRINSFTNDFSAYYGQSLNPRRLAPITWTAANGTRLTELEIATFISIANIVTSPVDEAVGIRIAEPALVLEPFYQCYSKVRTPVTVGEFVANVTRIFDCFYQSVDDTGWVLSSRQQDELIRLSRRSKGMDSPDHRYLAIDF